MTCTVILETKAKPGTGAQLVEAFRQILPDTRNKDGFVELTVHVNQDDPDDILLIERWTSRSAYETYLGWRQQRGDLDTLAAALAGPPRIRYFDATDA